MLARIPIWAGLLLGFAVLTAVVRADETDIANAKARAAAARKVYEGMLARVKIDPSASLDPEKPYQWSRRWLEAERDLSGKKAGQVTAAEGHLERMKKLEATIKSLLANKMVGPAEVAAAEFYRLKAEQTLAQTKK
jgi:hypothetical protein